MYVVIIRTFWCCWYPPAKNISFFFLKRHFEKFENVFMMNLNYLLRNVNRYKSYIFKQAGFRVYKYFFLCV